MTERHANNLLVNDCAVEHSLQSPSQSDISLLHQRHVSMMYLGQWRKMHMQTHLLIKYGHVSAQFTKTTPSHMFLGSKLLFMYLWVPHVPLFAYLWALLIIRAAFKVSHSKAQYSSHTLLSRGCTLRTILDSRLLFGLSFSCLNNQSPLYVHKRKWSKSITGISSLKSNRRDNIWINTPSYDARSTEITKGHCFFSSRTIDGRYAQIKAK